MTDSKYCIYIPHISGFYSKETVAHIISSKIGQVEYIDTVNIINPGPRLLDYDFSAFIHMSKINHTTLAQHIWFDCLAQNKPYEFDLGMHDDECWILIKHPENLKSTHDIMRLEAIIQNQSQEINRIQKAIYHILGHCYNQQNDSDSSNKFRIYNMMMYGKSIDNRWMLDENDDGTTEYECAFMEEDTIEDLVKPHLETRETFIVPPLGKIIDVSSSVIPVPDRLKNTAELCGNN